jgi:thioredoxin-dependent peroxiredoxin
MIKGGDIAPEFCLPDSDKREVCIGAYRGKWVVLYFYPKDNTSGCTREAVDFTNALKTLKKLGAEVLGVSPDSLASHEKFAEKHGLGVKLLSDPDHTVMEAYGVWALKKIYGREGYGVIRSTFLIDPDGYIAHLWRSVKVKGHVDEVIKTAENLAKSKTNAMKPREP